MNFTTKTIKIFLDMDGVLANFFSKLNELHHGKLDLTKYSGGIESEEKFWKPVNKMGNHKFWKSLKPLPWTEELVKYVISKVGKENVFIASMPAREPCATAKIKWIEKHIPWVNHRNYIMTPHKHLLSQPRRLLIDDCVAICHKWHTLGGQTILFPQPWNTIQRAEWSPKDILNSVKPQIDHYCKHG